MPMRPFPILFLLACVPAFSQDTFGQDNGTPLPDNAGQRFENVLKLRLGDILSPQRLEPAAAFSLGPLLMINAAKNCSIPLLKASPLSTPVPMPGAAPGVTLPNGSPAGAGTLDRMTIVAPAPACRTVATGPSTAPATPLFRTPGAVRILPLPGARP
jgi:hypothetical protein